MGQVSYGVQLDDDFLDGIDRELAQLEMLARSPVLKAGMKDAGEIVEQRLQEVLPKPGYPGDKPELTPLRDATATKVVEYQDEGKIVSITGYDYTAGGQHGHLVEAGHEKVLWGVEIGGFVEGRHYLEDAAKATESQQEAAITGAIESAIAAATG